VAFEVDGDDRVPLFLGHVHEHPVAEDPGVVDEDVEAAELVERLLHEPLRAGEVGDVLAVRRRFAAGGADLLDDLLRRAGASYHKVSGFFWKADVEEQKDWVRKYRRQKREAGPGTRRYFVDACHPVWGVDLLYSCWLLTGQRFYVGVGNGRKRLNILGAYSPDDHDYVDLRLTKENITGEQFVKLLEALLAKHPETAKFILYLDNARYYSKPCVKEWLARHRQFRLVPLPAYSPNLNLIERLWKFLKQKALRRWHKTFAALQQAVSDVLDHLEEYREELTGLMAEHFHIIAEAEIPVEYREVA